LPLRYYFPSDSVVQHFRGQQGDPAVMMFVVVPGKERLAKGTRVLDGAEALRELGPVLEVLNWLSEYGLSSETCGRLWFFVTPRSAINSATGFEVIEVPLSAWMVRVPATMPCFLHVSAISRLANSAVSREPPSNPRRSG